MLVRFNNKEDWLLRRKGMITSTMASAILGLNPYMSSDEAWELLVGIREPVDISHKDYVQKGQKAEKHIRALWALDHPEYDVEELEDNDYRLWVSDKYPFLGASGDGAVTLGDKKGMLEIKTTAILSSMQNENWSFKDEVKIPDNYYLQVLLELYCSECDFVVLVPELMYSEHSTSRRTIFINKDDVQEDIDYVVKKCVEFYEKYVVKGKRPPRVISWK